MPDLTVAAVFRSGGGEYRPNHAVRLHDAVCRNLRIPFRFVLLSDDPTVPVRVHPLEHDWPGWWAKMELFRLPGPVLYFDLDTVILGDLQPVAEWIAGCAPGTLAMLRDFYSGMPASGMMAWNGDLSPMLHAFRQQWERGAVRGIRGDQDWIRRYVREKRMPVKLLQDVFDQAILSYKVHVRDKAIDPTRSTVVCFHGRPRPWELEPMPQWMRTHWMGQPASSSGASA